MEKKHDFSWRDFFALLIGYVVSALCVSIIFIGMGYMRARGVVSEDIFIQYEFVLAIATALGFGVGGYTLAAMRPKNAKRNALFLIATLILLSTWVSRDMWRYGMHAQDLMIANLQIAGGLLTGVWIFTINRKKNPAG